MFSGLNEIIKRDYAYFLLRMYYSISFIRFNDQKTHQFSYTENTYSALIGQITHAWPSPANNNRVAVLITFYVQN